jgi:hypothetical protein
MKIAENNMTNKIIRYFKAESKMPAKGALFAYLTIGIILLYVVNNLRYFGITQLDEKKLISCMWSANIALGIAVIGNFALILKRPVWLYFFVQMLIDAAAIISVFFVYRLYPFIFSNGVVNAAIRAALIFIAFCLFVAFLIEFYRFGINVHLPKKTAAIGVEPSSTGESPTSENVLTQDAITNNTAIVQSTSLTVQKEPEGSPSIPPDSPPPSPGSSAEVATALPQKADGNKASTDQSESSAIRDGSDQSSKPSFPPDSPTSLDGSTPEDKTALSQNPGETKASADQSTSTTTPKESGEGSKPSLPPDSPPAAL